VLLNILTNNKNVELRIAAGEALALVIEGVRSYMHGSDNEDQYDDTDDTDLDDLLGSYIDVSDLRSLLSELQHHTSHSVSKEALSIQRRRFRAISNSIETGTAPSEIITKYDNHIKIQGWSGAVLLRCARSVLGSGASEHLAANPFFSRILGYDVRAVSTREKNELKSLKRTYYAVNSPASKQKTRTRSKLRKDKSLTQSSDGLAGSDD
jgi:PAS domain-containing protein